MNNINQSGDFSSTSPSTPSFMQRQSFTKEDIDGINRKLNDVEHEDISFRSGIGGTKLAYIEGWKVIKIANDIFGFNGWNTTIVNICTEFVTN